jgi:hypothetical protein
VTASGGWRRVVWVVSMSGLAWGAADVPATSPRVRRRVTAGPDFGDMLTEGSGDFAA